MCKFKKWGETEGVALTIEPQTFIVFVNTDTDTFYLILMCPTTDI